MDAKESERFGNGSYPKLKKLLEEKHLLMEKRNHESIVYSIKSFDDLCFNDLTNENLKYDMIVMRLPFPQIIIEHQYFLNDKKGLDWILNNIRIETLGESPSFLLLGCGSSIQGLQMGRKLLS